MDSAISPNYRQSYLSAPTLERKLDVLEDQMNGWFLDHARVLSAPANPHYQHAGFAILTLLLVYVEAIACFLKGASSDGRSKEYFGFGMRQIFPNAPGEDLEAVYSGIYRQVRCGQLHQGITRGNVLLINQGLAKEVVAIRVDHDAQGNPIRIIIDPWWFLSHVENHFQGYIEKLRDPQQQDLRTNFERWFDKRTS